jgi:hypothetical protein
VTLDKIVPYSLCGKTHEKVGFMNGIIDGISQMNPVSVSQFAKKVDYLDLYPPP